MKKLLILAAVVAASLAAHADPAQSQAMRIEVSTAGLDLRNPADAAAMLGRIEAAVRPVCVNPNVSYRKTTAACIRDVMREAVQTLAIPELRSAFQQRSAPIHPVAQG